MIKSAVTVSLVNEARGGPFVFWDDLAAAFSSAAKLGFDAVEIFAPSPDAVDGDQLSALREEHQLAVAAVGTGAGMVIHGLSLTDEDAGQRQKAKDFIRAIIDFGGPLGAPAIIGSMQGRWTASLPKANALEWLSEALNELGAHAGSHGVPLIYEPLNRYETNLVNTVADGVELMRGLKTDNVRLLADLFHMQIEEADLAEAIRTGGKFIGHVHFVDSNRQAAGLGHMDFGPIISALQEIDYQGYLSAEAFALPDSQTAAAKTIEAFNALIK